MQPAIAWTPLGWECVAFSEIDKAACSVLRHHYPYVPNLGDVTKITGEHVADLGADLVVFGFPCQDLSVAGKRAGLRNLDGENTRSGLFFDAIRIVRQSGARWAVAENVPGLFSSNAGLDFAAVVGEMAGVHVDVPDGGWKQTPVFSPGSQTQNNEWATLDAQYFGVPQRRRRVFIVRDTGDRRSRPPLFLVAHSLTGYPPPSREAGKRVAGSLSARTEGGGGLGTDFECSGGVVEAPIGRAALDQQVYADNRIAGKDASWWWSHALRAEGFDA